eukprot:CAMPEP_0201945024 /NCGR_PEP_ID=MMETSP0903-20130614/53690_1 /ASSEMBLY_ACC=CAM_ASM_000552 /TAXON_ID=420261 /ORGANISM="Thalassiosira antarctica, Strain CCMP982" /LENGTH=442 /DNA_ID=CAMNT_0048488083 /DNA_START=349 /DNA_END=1679 /DNA_ORIENTATION=+
MTSAEDTINLGDAGNYAILGKTGISTVPSSAITGDIAVSPIVDTAMTGFSFAMDPSTEFSTSAQITGNAYAANYGGTTPADLTAAVSAMEAAYTDAAGRTMPSADRINYGEGFLGGNYGGPEFPLTPGVYHFGSDVNLNYGEGFLGGNYGGPEFPLTPGVYHFGSDVNLKSDVHFSGKGVYIIQITGNLKQAANFDVILDPVYDGDGPAQANDIFWQVAGYVEVGTGAKMQGIILAKTRADFLTGSSLEGRVLTQTACNLQSAKITQPAVAAPTAAPTTGSRRGLNQYKLFPKITQAWSQIHVNCFPKSMHPTCLTSYHEVHSLNDVHFSGKGVYIIQITGNLKQAANFDVILDPVDDGDGPAQANDIFWQVAGYVEVGTGAKMQGIILAKTRADFLTGSSLEGRVLTQTACNLQSAKITQPAVAAPTAAPTTGSRRGLRSI